MSDGERKSSGCRQGEHLSGLTHAMSNVRRSWDTYHSASMPLTSFISLPLTQDQDPDLHPIQSILLHLTSLLFSSALALLGHMTRSVPCGGKRVPLNLNEHTPVGNNTPNLVRRLPEVNTLTSKRCFSAIESW